MSSPNPTQPEEEYGLDEGLITARVQLPKANWSEKITDWIVWGNSPLGKFFKERESYENSTTF